MSERNGVAPTRAAPDVVAMLLELINPLLIRPEFSQAATEFLSKAAKIFDCDRASLGVVVENGIKLAAVSRHYGEIGTSALPEVTAAMEESILQDAILAYPQAPSDFPYIAVAHSDLVRHNNLCGALTVPLACDSKLIGAITFERGKSGRFDPDLLWMAEKLASDIGPILHLKWKLTQPLWIRCLAFMRSHLSRESGAPLLSFRYVAIAVAACCAAWLFAFPVSNRIAGQARLDASVQRVISVPFDGYLKEVHVRPGERVHFKQLLAVLDGEVLLAQRRKVEAEIAQQENSLAESMVKMDRGQVATHASKIDELVAQRDLIDSQLDQSQLRAPFDGVVIKGDLTQMLGSPLKRSDTLLTLSEGDGFRVTVDISERDIADVKVGQSGTLALAALPSESFRIHVAKIMPVANVTTDGQNVFEIEAAIDASNPVLAPGLKGVAKIEVGHSPIGWKWVTRAWHAAAYAIWSRLG